MIKKHDVILMGLTLTLTLGMIVINDMTLVRPKPIATVDLKGLTDEFLSLATRSKLSDEQMTALVSEFTSSLEDGVDHLAVEYVLLTKRAVISEEIDLTDDLRDYVAGRISKQVKK